MGRSRLQVSKNGLVLFLIIFLLVFRDFVRVLLGGYVYTTEGWSFERYTGGIVSICIITALVLLILYYFQYCFPKELPQRIRISFFVVLVITIFWTVHSVITVNGYSISTLDGTAKTIFLMMIGIFVGYNRDSWEKIYRSIPLLAFIYLLAAAGYVVLVRFGSISGHVTNQSPYWMFYSAGFWVFAYFLLCYKEKTVLFTFILMLLNLIIVSFTVSRGWLIQTIFLYIVFFLKDNTFSKNRKRIFILSFILILAFGVYMLRSELLAAYSSYLAKFTSLSSRTNQYDAFFSQVGFKDLIFGKGEYASYSYKGNSNYIYVDNSYLYYAFHFGLLFALIMLFLPLRAGLDALRSKSGERKIGLVLLMWIAALNGFSVFCAGYEVSFRLLFIMMLIGRAMYIRYYDIENA